MSLPSKTIRPLVGVAKRNANRATVVLPEPDSPTKASVLPLAMLMLTSSTARRVLVTRTGNREVLDQVLGEQDGRTGRR